MYINEYQGGAAEVVHTYDAYIFLGIKQESSTRTPIEPREEASADAPS